LFSDGDPSGDSWDELAGNYFDNGEELESTQPAIANQRFTTAKAYWENAATKYILALVEYDDAEEQSAACITSLEELEELVTPIHDKMVEAFANHESELPEAEEEALDARQAMYDMKAYVPMMFDVFWEETTIANDLIEEAERLDTAGHRSMQDADDLWISSQDLVTDGAVLYAYSLWESAESKFDEGIAEQNDVESHFGAATNSFDDAEVWYYTAADYIDDNENNTVCSECELNPCWADPGT